jgi:hypothetical protein
MASSFDYSADTPTDAVASVADSIRSSHRLAPLTEEQKLQRMIEMDAFRQEQSWAEAERRAERERIDAEAEAVARHEAAIELAARNRAVRERAQQDYLARQERQQRSNDLAALRSEAQQSAMWRNTVQNAIAYERRQTLVNELESALMPPQPVSAPEPEVIEVEQPAKETGRLDYPKLHRWF